MFPLLILAFGLISASNAQQNCGGPIPAVMRVVAKVVMIKLILEIITVLFPAYFAWESTIISHLDLNM